MTSFFTIILLVIAAIAANIVYDIYPKIPLAFYQIGAGVLLSLVPLFNNFHLQPEVFMLAIIAPLMFNDGQNTDTHLLRRNLNSTVSLAIILALVTIVIGGILTHALWSLLPLALSFALAAIVTPTDAVAVSSITNNIEMPEHVMGTLENESLFNDASGIVALDLALTAYTTGQFSLTQGLEHFLVVFFGGILVGIVLGLVIVMIRIQFQRQTLDTIAVILPFNLMTPFVVYLAAEHLGLSGILAVVAAGIVHGLQGQRLRLTSTQTQLVTKTTWEVVTNLLNGFVFVLLGASGPSVWNDLSRTEVNHLPILLVIAVALYLLMVVMRFLWCLFSLVSLPNKETRIKDSFLIAISGVHGTITLAMAFSLPLTVAGHAFPYRSAIILIAGTIILLSLILPTLILPLILPHKKQAFTDEEFNDYLVRMVNFAIESLKNHQPNAAALTSVIEVLNSQKNQLRKNADSKVVNQLLERSETAERAAISEMIENGEVDRQVGWQYSRIASLQTQFAFLSPLARFKMWVKMIFFRIFPQSSNKRYQQQIDQQRQNKLQWLKDHGSTDQYQKFKTFYEQHKGEYTARFQENQNNNQLHLSSDLGKANQKGSKSKHPGQRQFLAVPDDQNNTHHHLSQRTEKQKTIDKESQARITEVTLSMAENPSQNRHRRHTLSRKQRREFYQQSRSGGFSEEYLAAFQKINEKGYAAVMSYLDSVETDDNQLEVDVVRHFYNVRRNRFNKAESSADEENELFLMAFQYEYSFVQNAEKRENPPSELVKELHTKISMDQMVYIQNGD
ncbi:cation:proton antiporter [Secundilactobacillus folii]|nr:sodium:proton antiporter [Secundilactobacillus folii]